MFKWVAKLKYKTFKTYAATVKIFVITKQNHWVEKTHKV